VEGVFLELAWESHSFLDAAAHFTRAFNVDTLEKPKPVPRQLLDDATALRDIWEHSDDYPISRRPTEPKKRATKELLICYEVDGHNTALAFAFAISFDPPAVVLGQRVDVGEFAAYARQLLDSPA